MTCSDVKENDMRAYSDLGRPFYDLCFDDAHKSFYVSAFDFASTNQITQYDYNTWARVATYKTQGSAKYIHCQNDKILALSQDAGYYCVEIIDTNAPTNTFSTIPVTTALTKTDNQLHLNISSLAQTVYHPTKPYIYMTDTDDFSVHLVNKEKALETKLSTAYAPTSLAYYANELYIGYGAQGIIDIVDADTLALKEKIFAVDPFFSMVVGNDGFIYTNDESHLISISRTTKQVVYTGSDWNGYGYGYGHLESSAGSNALYFKDNSNSLFGFVYADGQIISSASIPISYNSGGLKDRNRISPDGRYVFNGSGEVFDTSNMQQGGIKRVEQSPIDSFDDLVFDLDHNRVMASNMTNTVYAYDYTTLEKTDFLRVKGNAVSMHMEKDAISVISQLDDEYMLASYDTSSFSPFESLGIQDPHGDGVALQSNGYLYLSPYVQYSDGTSISLTYNTAEYQSSDPDVVTVDAQGRLQAHAYGTATITISWGGQTKEIPVVVQPILTYVYLSSGTLTQSFNSAVKNYTITVPQNTTVPPTIFGSLPYDSQDHIDVLSAASLDDKTIVRVVSSDGTCFTDYTFDFELSAYIESDHPYHNNGNEQWTYTAENPLDTVHLTFSSDTFVERDYDYIYIKDANDADIAGSPFTGDELAGKTVHIPGGTAKITLTSDAWTTGYGFKITNITTSSISGGGGGGGGGSNGNTSTNRDFEAHSLSVTDDSQNPFSASSTEMSAITMIKNISDTTKHVSLYMTLLDADGKTLEVRCVKKDLLPNAAADVSGRVAIPADGKAASFRVFVWDDATQQPIVPSVEVHKETNQ